MRATRVAVLARARTRPWGAGVSVRASACSSLGARAAPAWVPFGSGSRRCVGVGFAIAEMDLILRTVLLDFEIQTDSAPDENPVETFAYVPGRGGRIVVTRRK